LAHIANKKPSVPTKSDAARDRSVGGRTRSDIGYGEAADIVYTSLKERIFDGGVRPGERIVEAAVAEYYGVSRTPVREAISRLVSEGIIERSRGRGLIVVELLEEEVEDLYVTRMVLEGLAARLAAGRRSSHDITTLEEIQDQMEVVLASGDIALTARINFVFHSEIQRIAGNRTSVRFMEQIHEALRRFGTTTFSVESWASTAVKEHRALIERIRAQDADGAESVARNHIEGALSARLALLTRRRLRFSDASA